MKLKEVIKKYREDNKISMQEFASRSGLSKGYVSMLESGKHPQNNRPLTPSIATYQKIAKGMGISLDDLLHLVDGDEIVSVGKDFGRTEYEQSEARRRVLMAFDQLNPQDQELLATYAETTLALRRLQDTH